MSEGRKGDAADNLDIIQKQAEILRSLAASISALELAALALSISHPDKGGLAESVNRIAQEVGKKGESERLDRLVAQLRKLTAVEAPPSGREGDV